MIIIDNHKFPPIFGKTKHKFWERFELPYRKLMSIRNPADTEESTSFTTLAKLQIGLFFRGEVRNACDNMTNSCNNIDNLSKSM